MLKVVLVALGLCLLEISVIVVASPLAKPALVLRFQPEDVRLAAQGHPEPPLWKQLIAHALLAGFLVAMLAGVFYVGREGLRDGCGFWGLTLRFIVLLYVMKAFDIIVQDRWLVMTVGYFKRLYPETAGCAGLAGPRLQHAPAAGAHCCLPLPLHAYGGAVRALWLVMTVWPHVLRSNTMPSRAKCPGYVATV